MQLNKSITFEEICKIWKSNKEDVVFRTYNLLATKSRFSHVFLRKMRFILIFHANMQHIYDIQLLPTIPFISVRDLSNFNVLLNNIEEEEELSI